MVTENTVRQKVGITFYVLLHEIYLVKIINIKINH